MQDEGWRPSITVKNILTGIQVPHSIPSYMQHEVLLAFMMRIV